ncbi:hypothetical protein [Streptomyces millisiae]|uniref:Uncharacterized protein n=1 Tax=Streptomyces millisiae TaxID=3075542 RepID=A0ABU2LYK1_9ACTN|nr:hypothetical protein [Streptomyces sp. DSM 44918]MDT0322680.1 hypothetical protein [Streptomyces sp. DSM 44918]
MADARRGMASLTPARRRAVNDAVRGPLATRPLTIGELFEGTGPTALRRLVLTPAGVSIGYRVFADRVEVRLVWLIGHP